MVFKICSLVKIHFVFQVRYFNSAIFKDQVTSILLHIFKPFFTGKKIIYSKFKIIYSKSKIIYSKSKIILQNSFIFQVRSPGKADIDSSFFKLHYRTTTTILFIGTILVTANSFIGKPIDCMSDGVVPGNVLNTYCWIMSTFSIPSK